MSVGVLLLSALGLAVAIEGIAYAAAPEAMKRFARMISQLPAEELRRAGLLAGAAGASLIYLVARLS